MGRHVWGPLTEAGAAAIGQEAAAVTTAAPPVKRRRTRWAQAEEQDATAKAIVLFPDKVVLSNGMQVSCGQLGSVERVDLHAVHSRHATLLCRHAFAGCYTPRHQRTRRPGGAAPASPGTGSHVDIRAAVGWPPLIAARRMATCGRPFSGAATSHPCSSAHWKRPLQLWLAWAACPFARFIVSSVLPASKKTAACS